MGFTKETEKIVEEDNTYMNDKTKPKVNQTKYLLFSIFAMSILVIYSFHTIYKSDFGEKTVKKQPLSDIYIVFIDAARSGSKLTAFAYILGNNNTVAQEDKLNVDVKPGLSSFADDPKKGAESIDQLLAKAKNFVPERNWKKTPLVIRISSVLMLLPKEKRDGLLREVIHSYELCPFLKNTDAIVMVDSI